MWFSLNKGGLLPSAVIYIWSTWNLHLLIVSPLPVSLQTMQNLNIDNNITCLLSTLHTSSCNYMSGLMSGFDWRVKTGEVHHVAQSSWELFPRWRSRHGAPLPGSGLHPLQSSSCCIRCMYTMYVYGVCIYGVCLWCVYTVCVYGVCIWCVCRIEKHYCLVSCL